MEIFGNVQFIDYRSIYVLIYMIIPCAILLSFKRNCQIYKTSISIEVTYAFKGAAMLIIMVHHFGGFLNSSAYIKPYDDMGYIGSGIFLWFAGYGIAWCYKHKENYEEGFIRKRILPIYTKSLICICVTGIVSCLLTSQELSLEFIKVLYLRNYWNSTQVWFFTAIIFCYFVIYFINKMSLKMIYKQIILFLILGIWIIVCIYLNKPPCWYNTILLFGLGYIWNYHIEEVLFKKNRCILIMGALICVLFFKWAYHAMWIKQMLYAAGISCYLSIIGRGLKVRGHWLKKIGQCSLEIYFLHSFVYMILYRNLNQVSFMKSSFSYYIVMAVCLVVSLLLNRGLNMMQQAIKK